jgi:hypothetical protein
LCKEILVQNLSHGQVLVGGISRDKIHLNQLLSNVHPQSLVLCNHFGISGWHKHIVDPSYTVLCTHFTHSVVAPCKSFAQLPIPILSHILSCIRLLCQRFKLVFGWCRHCRAHHFLAIGEIYIVVVLIKM